jgi:hypothetical protein
MKKKEHIELLETKIAQLESRLRTLETRLENYRPHPALPYTPWTPGVVWTSCDPNHNQNVAIGRADCNHVADAYVYTTKIK